MRDQIVVNLAPEFLAGMAARPSSIEGPKPTEDEQRRRIAIRGLRDAIETLAAVVDLTDGDAAVAASLALDAAMLASRVASRRTGVAKPRIA